MVSVLEYIIYHGALTISWVGSLTWYQSRSDKRSHIRISTIPHIKWNIQRMCASTLLTQRALVWGGVVKYIIYPAASTISLSFWLSWFLDGVLISWWSCWVQAYSCEHPKWTICTRGEGSSVGSSSLRCHLTGNFSRLLYKLQSEKLLQ